MISVVINVKNGEKYLQRCLNALTRFEDVVLLDNYSTDKTLEIAKNFSNVRIYQHEFCGMGKVRNMAAGFAKYDWVFFVDCDEIVNKSLVDKILNMTFENNCVYKVSRHNYYDNFLIEGATWGKEWIHRIYNRNNTQFRNNEVHDNLNMKGLATHKIFPGFIYHFPYENVSQLIEKMQFYSTLYAKQHLGKKKVKLYLLPFRTIMMFIKSYILKKGFQYGYEGLTISAFNAIGVFAKYIKLYELSYKFEIALAIKINNLDNCSLILEKINEQTLLPNFVFIISENTLSIDCEENLKLNLIVPNTVLKINNQEDIKILLNNQLLKDNKINKIVYIEDLTKLSDKTIFKKCKQTILTSKKLNGILIY
ncbi:MAG TPA: glycosyltransferase family 2 protein [Burkholderiales bacterium]|nr:glycosyltransferase family 2 protein [Burkholderiales bacterium]